MQGAEGKIPCSFIGLHWMHNGLNQGDFICCYPIALIEFVVGPLTDKRNVGNEGVYTPICVLGVLSQRDEKSHEPCPQVSSVKPRGLLRVEAPGDKVRLSAC